MDGTHSPRYVGRIQNDGYSDSERCCREVGNEVICDK